MLTFSSILNIFASIEKIYCLNIIFDIISFIDIS